MIHDQRPWTAAARRVAGLLHPARRGNRGRATADPAVVIDALQVLVWAASHRAPAPQAARATTAGTVVLDWDKAGGTFRVEVLAPGAVHWRASGPAGGAWTGRVLDREAAHLLRSLVCPVARPARTRTRRPGEGRGPGPGSGRKA